MSEFENLPELPQWLQDVLPQPRVPLKIRYENGQFVLQHPSLDTQTFDTLEEAYDMGRVLEKEHVADVGGMIFDGEYPEGYKDWGRGTFVTVKKSSRLLLFNDDSQSYDVLRYSYQKWLEYAAAYDNEPTSFAKSYFFVDQHPMFWIRSSRDEDFNAEHPFSWETQGHIARYVLHEVYFDHGKHQHALETGSHIPPDYTGHYHDHLLDVFADTYEEAIIKLAQNIAVRYHHDGTEKESTEAKEE